MKKNNIFKATLISASSDKANGIVNLNLNNNNAKNCVNKVKFDLESISMKTNSLNINPISRSRNEDKSYKNEKTNSNVKGFKTINPEKKITSIAENNIIMRKNNTLTIPSNLKNKGPIENIKLDSRKSVVNSSFILKPCDAKNSSSKVLNILDKEKKKTELTSASVIAKSVTFDDSSNNNNIQDNRTILKSKIITKETKKLVLKGTMESDKKGKKIKSSKTPSFIQHLTDTTCSAGDRVELVAKVSGAEKVLWFKNNKILPTKSIFKYIVSQGVEKYKFVIKDAFPQDSGSYSCEASNLFGKIKTTSNLTVNGSTMAEEQKISEENKETSKKNDESVSESLKIIESSDFSLEIDSIEKESKNEFLVNNSIIEEISPREPQVLNEKNLKTQLSIPSEVSAFKEFKKSQFNELLNKFEKSSNGETKVSETSSYLNKKTELENEYKEETHNISLISQPNINNSSYSSDQHFHNNNNEKCDLKINEEEQKEIEEELNSIFDLAHKKTDETKIENINEHEVDMKDKTIDGFLNDISSCISVPLSHDSNCNELNETKIDIIRRSSIVTLTDSPLKEPLFLNFRDESQGRSPIVIGPNFLIALKDESLFIRIKFSGIPGAKVQWTKNGKDCENIVENSELSSVHIEKVNYDDSGRYLAKVFNDHDIILHHCFLSVKGPPDPPLNPPIATYHENIGSISVSWCGSPYDGGSVLTAYILEASIDEKEWEDFSSGTWLTFSIVKPIPCSSYRFRVKCQNIYGVGPPSSVSPPVCIPGFHESDESSEISELAELNVQIRSASLSDYYFKGEELGKGRFGLVFSVKEKETNKDFAGKIIRCIKAADKVKVRQEVEIMNVLRHPKLLQIFDALENEKEICIITEKINGGELFERVVADDFTLTEFDCVGFMRQICDGVKYMHSKSIIHLDLKPENILCLTRSTYSIKIIDFGLSQKYDPSVPLRVLFGTPEFIAPEIINYEPISLGSDMWALGVITYVLLSGLSPFMGDSDSETFSNITDGDFDFDDEAFGHISEEAKDFISKLIVRRKEKRMTAVHCLAHKWLAYPETKMNIVIPTDKLKRFIIRRKWQKTGNAIRALGRIATLYSSRRSSEAAANANSRKSNDSGIFENGKTRDSSLDENFTSDEVQAEKKRQLLQRQNRVDSA